MCSCDFPVVNVLVTQNYFHRNYYPRPYHLKKSETELVPVRIGDLLYLNSLDDGCVGVVTGDQAMTRYFMFRLKILLITEYPNLIHHVIVLCTGVG